jgi:hypothetical protein
MGPGAHQEPAGGIDALTELDDHLERVQQVLAQHGPGGGEPAVGSDGKPLSSLLAVVHRALARFEELVTGRQRLVGGRLRLALTRHGRGTSVFIERAANPSDIAAFIDDLRRADARLLACAELIALLIHLSVGWSTAGFALPAIVRSLREHAPQILALAEPLADPPASPDVDADVEADDDAYASLDYT